MFLRNFDNVMLLYMMQTSVATSGNVSNIGGYSIFGDKYINVRVASGSTTSVYLVSGSSCYVPFALCSKGICLGTGTTEVTYEDYKLSGSIVTNKLVQIGSNTYTFNEETNKWTVTAKFTYSNTTSSDVTINEWGLWRTASTSQTDFTHGSNSILTFREVLDEPIVIEAGTTATLTFSVDIPMPNHP